jgi:DNA-binding XRE family transcriptional regulator
MTPSDLRAARAASGLTQSEWGQLLGIGRQHVSSMERGVDPPSPTLAILIQIIIAIGIERAQEIRGL